MIRFRFPGRTRFGLVTLGLLLVASPTSAHVLLHEPNGGEQLEVGSTFTITWEILATHFLMDWDLWYSMESSTGPWITIVMNEAPGSPAVGSIHTYDWTIPDVLDDSVWVRVKMDNIGDTDYYDVSDLSFSIVHPRFLAPATSANSSRSPSRKRASFCPGVVRARSSTRISPFTRARWVFSRATCRYSAVQAAIRSPVRSPPVAETATSS